MLEESNGTKIEHSMGFKFNIPNNHAENEALIVDLALVNEMGLGRVEYKFDT